MNKGIDYYAQKNKNTQAAYGFPGRNKFFEAILQSIISLGQSKIKILDIGCGSGELLKYISVRLKDMGKEHLVKSYTGLDKQASLSEEIRSHGMDFIRCDITKKLPKKYQKKYDLVICSEVIEHVIETDSLILNAKSALKEGGVLILTTPNLLSYHGRLMAMLGYQPLTTEVSQHNASLGRNKMVDRLYCRGMPSQVINHVRVFSYRAVKEFLEFHNFEVKKFFGLDPFFPKLWYRIPSFAPVVCAICKVKKTSVVVSTHSFATGPAQDLVEYINENKDYDLMFIRHPLYKEVGAASLIDVYHSGKKVYSLSSNIQTSLSVVNYVKDAFLSFLWVLKSGKKWDLYIGCNNLNALSGLVLKKLGLVKKLVYYVIDYDPKRFSNKFLNSLYHKIDRLCVLGADVTWNLSPVMSAARKEYFDFDSGIQVTLPVGIWHDRIPKRGFSEIEKHTLAFMGHVIEKQGVQHLINVMPRILERIPDFKLLVIGGGNYIETLTRMAKAKGVSDKVKFTGYIEDHREVEKLLSGCGAGIALYQKYTAQDQLSFTNFADPMKLKVYMSAGLPVLLTEVPFNARDIQDKRCGLIVNESPQSLTRGIYKIMENEQLQEKMRNNAIDYASRYNWKKIFEIGLGGLV